MKKLLRLTLFFSLFVVSVCTTVAASPAGSVPEGWFNGAANMERAARTSIETNVPLVVYFYVDWCPYCHALENEYFPAAPVRDYLNSVVKIRINPESSRADHELGEVFGIRGYPSFFVIPPKGAPVKLTPFRRNGANLTPAEFAQSCRNVAATESARTVEPPRAAPKLQIVEVPRTVEAAAPKFVASGPLPTAEAVFNKYTQVTGADTTSGRTTSRVIKGRINVPGRSFGGRFEFYATATGKTLTVISVEPLGVVKQGFDGRSGWTSSENTSKDKNIPELAILAAADLYRAAKLAELYPKTKFLGKINEGGRDVYLIEAAPRSGAAEKLYFDAQTGLLVQRDFTRSSARGQIDSEIYFSDWRKVDGFSMPCGMTQMIGNLTLVITVDEIKHNVAIDEAIFQHPT